MDDIWQYATAPQRIHNCLQRLLSPRQGGADKKSGRQMRSIRIFSLLARLIASFAITLSAQTSQALESIPNALLEEAIAMDRVSEIAGKLRIREQGKYSFGIAFYGKPDIPGSIELLRRIAGKRQRDPDTQEFVNTGAPLRILLRISDENTGKVIYEKDATDIPLWAGSGNHFLKVIEDIALPRGLYSIIVRNLEPVPESTEIRTTFFVMRTYVRK